MVYPYSHFGVYLFLHVPLLSLPMLTKKWPRTLPNLSLVLLCEQCFSDQVLLQVRGAGLTPWLVAASVVPGEFLERPTDG